MQKRWLEYYALQFNTVEINNTFYRLPEPPAFEAWRERVPGNFLYAIKASRFLTHMKRLKAPEEPLDRLFARLRLLRRSSRPRPLPTAAAMELSMWNDSPRFSQPFRRVSAT